MSGTLQSYGLSPATLLCPWDFPSKNTGVGCHILLQEIFLTQGLNPHFLCLLHWQVSSLPPAPPQIILLASTQQYGWSCLSLWSERMPGSLSDGALSRGRTAGLASHSRAKASTALPMRGTAVLQQNPSDKSLSAYYSRWFVLKRPPWA